MLLSDFHCSHYRVSFIPSHTNTFDKGWFRKPGAGTYLGNIIDSDNVLVGVLVGLVNDSLDRVVIVLTSHLGGCVVDVGDKRVVFSVVELMS